MEKLRYSGRGRPQGRGPGRGYGRGRGGPWRRGGRGRISSNNNNWVRSRDDQDNSSPPRSESPTSSSETSSLGPILSGPRNHGYNNFAGRHHGRGRFSGRGRGRGRSYPNYHQPVPMNSWTRVITYEDDSRTNKTAEQQNEVSESDRSEGSEGKTTEATTNVPNQLVSRGKYKLVLAKGPNSSGELNPEIPSTVTTSKPMASEWEETTKEEPSFISKGSNKLVLAKSQESFKPDPAWKSMKRVGPQKRSNSPVNAPPAAKRIKLSVSADEEETRVDGETKGKNVDRLTDFAYRESSSKHRPRGGRGGGRGRFPGRGRGQNMGLVRVPYNESKTPICPIFLRGIRCENEQCTKRHDVPRESAMPVCSFFQRNGQCLRGANCPFRHVKVNPLAMLCPSFNLLGYCNDDQCEMKHVTSTNNNNNNNKSALGRHKANPGK